MSSTMASSWARLSLSWRRAWPSASARRAISAWRTACSRLASAGSSRPASAVRAAAGSGPCGRPGGRCRHRPAAGRAAGWPARWQAAVISWRATSRMRSASRSPSARGTGSRPASRRSAASTARWASIGSDLPFPRRCLRLGCSALDHQQASGGQRPRQPDPVAAAALDADRHPRPGRHLRDGVE